MGVYYTYGLEINQIEHPVLVKEQKIEYMDIAMNDPKKIVNFVNAVFRLNKQAEEHMVMLAFDTRMKLLGLSNFSHGCVCATFCNPRELFIRCLLMGARYVVLVHNHPSGDVVPSIDDKTIANQIRTVGSMMKVDLQDFIIIGSHNYYSMREENEDE